ncbi:MAG: hypothetical protein M9896_15965 [Candidatus Promineofilum sp.]|uniref:phage major capsid protein n=1 Tax=Promineifilum sp. TaxID=2664178 RepID=UPI002412092E|nr:hypothetical protein [Promineifilum sp.]
MSERRQFIGTLIAAGPTRTMTGEAGGYVVTAEAIRRAIDEGLFRGLACFADHAAGGPSVRRLVGVWRDVGWVAGGPGGGAAVGRLVAYETAETRPVLDLLDQWLADGGEEETPDLGISIVFYPRLAADGRTVTALTMVESADVVMFPASEGARIGGWSSVEQRSTEQYSVGQFPVGQDSVRRGEGIIHSHSQTVKQDERRGRLHIDGSKTGRQTQKENSGMTHETDVTEVRRVALVRGGGEATAVTPQAVVGKNDGAGAATGSAGFSAAASPFDDWLGALKTATATAVIRASGLPAVVQERLGAGAYETADDVYAAVERARAELAALREAEVVRLDGLGAAGRSARGYQLRDPLDEARELLGFFFGAAGAPTPPPNLRSFGDLYVALTGDVYFRGVFDGRRVQFSGATTSTLPNLAVDAMNRVITEQFAALEHYRWYERVAAVEPNDGRLHDMKWITLGGIGNLPAVSEGAAYTELDVADAQETAAFVKRGGYVGITREMIKNGDIMQLQAIPRALAAAAVRTRSAAVSALFTANSGVGPTLAQDSKALFHVDHGNLATTALGTDATAWRAARSECFQQVELGSGKPLGVFPRFLLVPAELYDTALSILGYGEGMPTAYTPEAQARGFADPRPIPLVVPDWTDATDWAYVVDPALFPVIQMSYSQSPGGRQHPIPELFAVVSETSGLMFSNDVLPIKVRDEFAVGVNGARGIGKRNAA